MDRNDYYEKLLNKYKKNPKENQEKITGLQELIKKYDEIFLSLKKLNIK